MEKNSRMKQFQWIPRNLDGPIVSFGFIRFLVFQYDFRSWKTSGYICMTSVINLLMTPNSKLILTVTLTFTGQQSEKTFLSLIKMWAVPLGGRELMLAFLETKFCALTNYLHHGRIFATQRLLIFCKTCNVVAASIWTNCKYLWT